MLLLLEDGKDSWGSKSSWGKSDSKDYGKSYDSGSYGDRVKKEGAVGSQAEGRRVSRLPSPGSLLAVPRPRTLNSLMVALDAPTVIQIGIVLILFTQAMFQRSGSFDSNSF